MSLMTSNMATKRTSLSLKATPEVRPADVCITRRGDLGYEEFVQKYRNPRVPVILTDAITQWPALSKWSPEFFKARYYSTPVAIAGRYATDNAERRSLGETLDAIVNSSPSKPAPYLRNQNLIDLYPELRDDVAPVPVYTLPNWLDGPLSGKLDTRFRRGHPEVQISGPGAAFPSMHYDYGYIHTFLSQIYGRKKIKVFSPDQSRFVYPEPGDKHHGSRIPDIDNVDLEQFPLFARAVPMVAELEPGDTMFMPAGWWHTTRTPSVSITVSYNFANSSNWLDLSRACAVNDSFVANLKFQAYLFFLRLIRSALRH